MSETSETPTPPPHQTPKVFKAAAWVAIAAGTVFIVAVIFFTGYILGKHAGHGGFHHRQHHQHPAMMLRPGSPHGGPAAVRPGPGPAGPARCRRPSVLPRHPLRNRQPAARCPPKAPGCTSSWHVCNRNPLRWLRPSDIQKMTETPQPAAPPPSAATTSPPPSPQQEKPPRLYRAAAWVVIVAGIVFTVAVIFFSGALVLGQGKCPYHRYYHHGMFRPVGPVAPGPGMGWVFGFPGGPPPPGMGPGFPGGPGGPAVGPTGPGPTTAPARP